ncbi:MAG: PEP-utilizing enzyme, partial [Candidatus ainarchaeum sp.]|nr:PEP-utilizing enzyme [Candidatus ainarchaeum sp.]
VQIAMDMLEEGLINEKEAILRIDSKSLDQLLHKSLDPNAVKNATVLARGLPASPGAVFGKIVFDADKAFDEKEKGNKVILVRTETSPEDIKGMNAAEGILTQRGGMTSHAAVVARGMGKPCVSGSSEIVVYDKQEKLVIGDKSFKEGDFITIDGSLGVVYEGKLDVVNPSLEGSFAKL